MLLALSPAKTLDMDSATPPLPVTLPRFIPESASLIALLREFSPARLSSLMGISDKLATLNAQRYAAWSGHFDAGNSRPAILAFAGDVYAGLDAAHLAPEDLRWAQQHVAMLSGLYGVLRPLDLMQAYRLEMGTRLPNPAGPDLYAFWGSRIARALREDLAGHRSKVLLNLASQEYFRAVDTAALALPVIDVVFQQGGAGGWRVVGVHAKRARGLMARWIIVNRVDEPEQIRDFDSEGYVYAPQASDPARWVFRREAA